MAMSLKPGGKTANSGTFGLENEYSATVLKSLPSGEYLVRFELFKDQDPASSPKELVLSPYPHMFADPQIKKMKIGTKQFMQTGQNVRR